ncbi:unnamed protein product [Caenorhabditis brenneri]
MSSLPMFRIPSLVREQIVENMAVCDALSLSLTSKKGARIVKDGLRYFKPVYLNIVIGRKGTYVAVFVENETWSIINWTFQNSVAAKRYRKKHVWNVSRMEVLAGKKKTGEFDSVFCARSPPHLVDFYMDKMIRHFLSIFPKCTVKYLEVYPSDVFSSFNVARALSALQVVESVHLIGEDYRNESKFILENIEITKTCKTESYVFTGGQLVDKLKCTDEVDCTNATWMRLETLLSLNCKQVTLSKTRFRNQDLMEFLKKWKTSRGEEMKNIRRWKIDCPLGTMPLDLSDLDGTPTNPGRRPQKYQEVDCCGGIDIEREDGLLATVIQSSDTRIFFMVWQN